MFDPQRVVIPGVLASHVVDDGDEVSGANVAAAESRRGAKKLRHPVNLWKTRSAGHRVREGSFYLAQEGIGLHHGNVEPFDYGNRLHMTQRFDDFDRWERSERSDVQQPD